MEQIINDFIRHTITNLEGALEHQDERLTLAVLVNLSSVLDTYVEALYEMSDLSDTMIGQE